MDSVYNATMITIEKSLVEKLMELKKPAIIAVSGFGGAGKSTFSDLLGKRLHAPVIRLDSFARDRLENNPVLWDAMDFNRLEREVHIPFSAGIKRIDYGGYHWGENKVTETKSVENSGILIIEGVGLLRQNLNKYFAYKIWIDCPQEESIRRGKKRDREVYQLVRNENWDGIWRVNDTEYFEKYKPIEMADSIISNHENKNE